DKENAEAQFLLGNEYRVGGLGLKKSPKRAVQFYELAAAQGNAIAQNKLGVCYQHGTGVKINYKTAAQWYRRAAEQGCPRAQRSIGVLFNEGRGVAKSSEKAVKWYRFAAAQGEPDALFSLGVCYANGRGVPRDYDEALRLYKRAAALGHAGAVGKLEQLKAFLAVRHGRPRQGKATQGHAGAQDSFGGCYACRTGVKINHKTATQWYQRAAEQDYPRAQYNLG
ncbi:hypothetical protein M885DRAFT_427031, partial [Pelagophyceae sp. CCMP2097]